MQNNLKGKNSHFFCIKKCCLKLKNLKLKVLRISFHFKNIMTLNLMTRAASRMR